MLLDPKIRESFGTLGLRLDRIDETAPKVERFGLGSLTCWLPIILYCFFLNYSFQGNSKAKLCLFWLYQFQAFFLHTMALYFHFSNTFLSLSHPKYWTLFFFHFLYNFFPPDRFDFLASNFTIYPPQAINFPTFWLSSTFTALLWFIFHLIEENWLRFSQLTYFLNER